VFPSACPPRSQARLRFEANRCTNPNRRNGMARDLDVTNQLDQAIKVFVWEKSVWKYIDWVFEGGGVVTASATIAAAVVAAPEFVGSLVAIETVEDAIAFANRGFQVFKGTADFVMYKVPKLVGYVEAFQSAFDAKTVAVAPGATMQIMETSIWHHLLSAAGIASVVLSAETVSIFITTADKSRLMHFQSNPEGKWTITPTGAQDSVTGRSVSWDGAAVANNRPSLTTVVLGGNDNDAALYAPWLFWRDADSSVQAMEFLGGFWNKYPHPSVMTTFSPPAAAFHHATEDIIVAGVTPDQNQTAQYAATYNFGGATGEQGEISWNGGISGGVSLADDPKGVLWALLNYSNGAVANLGYDGPGIQPRTWGPVTMMFDIPTNSCPTLVFFQGRLYLSWIVQGDPTGKLMFGALNSDRSGVENPVQIPGAFSLFTPALSVFRNVLYAAWVVSDTQSLIWMSQFDGANWTQARIVPGFAPGGPPALTATGDYMLMVCSSPAPWNVLMFSISSDGIDWNPPRPVPVLGPTDDAWDPLESGPGN
jgi:hypothetical protein